MQKTPTALRMHVSIFGKTNAGKSSLFNAITGQDMVIVSEKKGTTTDPITKAMELIPYGPIALTDTAGLFDDSEIGEMRIKKTYKVLEKTDFAIYAASCDDFDENEYKIFSSELEKRKIPHMLVFTKCDLTNYRNKDYLKAIYTSVKNEDSIDELKRQMVKALSEISNQEQTMIGDLLPKGATVLMVVPVDSQAPKGRLILPQVQLIRDCLDHGIKSIVVRDTELEETLKEQDKIDLVVTDSQAFKYVNSVVPDNVKVTSFSMLTARLKGDIHIFIEGAKAIESLKDGSRVLMAEACTHSFSHEDIGRVKIPSLLKKYTGKNIEFDFSVYQDFPEDISDYALVIHCGGCMLNSRSMLSRIDTCVRNGVPITNYGVVLAYANGIVKRASKIFEQIR